MKLFYSIVLLFLCANVFAQKPDEVIAAANGRNYTIKDLAPEARSVVENLPKTVADVRRALLEQMINDALFEKEAAAQKTTIEKLVEKDIRSKVAVPNDAQIRGFYDANRQAIGNLTLAEVRPQIVAFITRQSLQKAFAEYLSDLKIKYKTALGKDVNAANLSRLEVLATVGDRQISVDEFETKNKIALSEIAADANDAARKSVEETIYNDLLAAEAKAQGIGAGDLMAREITDKMREFSDAERERLQANLREKLFKKYDAKIFLKESAPLVQTVSIDNQPMRGNANAPVTVVMFTDFQCPACSAAHPVLQKVLASYGDKIRFVVRDFPLVFVHENAFRAALAANAANAQGKFFEYTEILYKNQDKLDDESLKKYAAEVGLNVKQFEADRASAKIDAEVRRDIADGKNLAISGTPTVFVNGVKVRGLAAEDFRQAIEKALK